MMINLTEQKKEPPLKKKEPPLKKKEPPLKKKEPSVSPVTDDETTKKVDSKEDLTSIRVTDIEDYPTDKLKIKLFRTRLTQEPKGFLRDYNFIEAIQNALENKDTNKNLSGSNFVPGW